MEKYLNDVVAMAQKIGTIRNFSMEEANKYFPARFEVEGITPEGEAFAIDVRVGEKLHEDS